MYIYILERERFLRLHSVFHALLLCAPCPVDRTQAVGCRSSTALPSTRQPETAVTRHNSLGTTSNNTESRVGELQYYPREKKGGDGRGGVGIFCYRLKHTSSKIEIEHKIETHL